MKRRFLNVFIFLSILSIPVYSDSDSHIIPEPGVVFNSKNVISNNDSSKLLIVFSGYGAKFDSLCFDYIVESAINNINYDSYFYVYFNNILLETSFKPIQFTNFLRNKFNEEKYSSYLFFNIYRDSCADALISEFKIVEFYKIGFDLDCDLSTNILLVYDFDVLFDFLDSLNLPISNDIHYFVNFENANNTKDKHILRKLKDYNFNIIVNKVKDLSGLRLQLLKLNKNPDILILIFNIEYLYSDVDGKLTPITKLLATINTYNKKHISVNVSSICPSSTTSSLGLNMSFDIDYLFSNVDDITTMNARLELNLSKLNKQFLKNLTMDEIKILFGNVRLIQ